MEDTTINQQNPTTEEQKQPETPAEEQKQPETPAEEENA